MDSAAQTLQLCYCQMQTLKLLKLLNSQIKHKVVWHVMVMWTAEDKESDLEAL